VTDWCPPRRGGIEGQVAGLARALAARGHTVHLFTTTPNPCAIPGVDVHVIETAMVGDVAAQLTDAATARSAYRRALEIEPGNPAATRGLANLEKK